ncbi:MAG TPA: CinA family protein [Cycloclasticus sp.]|jgi:nicotinamide-nucleotide amidase|nr:CinA family protein [Cycloclasticus sp.]HIL93035.1 CinA family protein [Cycloclasticus sp.]
MTDLVHQDIQSLVKRLANNLLAQGKTLAVAESCTGGWLSKVLTDSAGSSAWFLGGVVSYNNSAKLSCLHVNDSSLSEFGAVSEQVVQEMATGAQRVFGSSFALSITGIAGPSGGSKSKPVGLVWFAVKNLNNPPQALYKVFDGNRDEVRSKAVKMALQLLIDATTN